MKVIMKTFYKMKIGNHFLNIKMNNENGAYIMSIIMKDN